MTLTCITWLFTIILTVHGQENFKTTPSTISSFSCRGRDTGFYADVDSNCEVYHTCDNHGNKFTYYCPKKTKFCQETLVCDHAHLVNCKNAEKLISKVPVTGSDENILRRSSSLSRTFRISQEPSVFLEAPREDSEKATTFTMSSTVFLRNSSVKRNNERTSEGFSHKSRANEVLGDDKSRNLGLRVQDAGKSTTKPFLVAPNYSPGGQTSGGGTTARTTTAGTEFPVPAFDFGAPRPGDDEDPYYPKNPVSGEVHYTVEKGKVHKPLGFFSTEKPFGGGVQIKIPDVLPDFNSVDDLVDRRKILYIPRTKGL
ncbi:uncharacterized protein [Fopius arisanus]|uniref:UL52 protein n=1 Tax=Fopius arisanus TaxID=64838 RepID=A0A0C9RMC2_9HYME|nr:PREDICTED: uncharacterized protein LOC105263986 [Fopius arisanus]